MEMDYPKTRMDNFFAKAAGSELADNSMEPITDREYWINELAARLAEGGLVPPIEEGDDGKVLTVDEGAAVWAEGGGGSGNIYLELDSGTGSIDASFNELQEYYNDGKLVLLKNVYDDGGTTHYEWYIMTEMRRVPDGASLTFYAYFSAFPFFEDGVHIYSLIFTSTDADENMVIYD